MAKLSRYNYLQMFVFFPASSIAPASLPGFLISSFWMDKYGRKKAHVLTVIPAIIGWILIFFAKNIYTLILGRILNGFSGGCTVILGAVIIGEYTSPEHRGTFLTMKTVAVCLGNMAVHVLGNFITWNQVALVAMVPHTVAFFIILTWPESPSWLASKQKFQASEKAFNWLRGTNPDARKELAELIRAQKGNNYEMKTSLSEKILYVVNKFTKREFLKPTFVMIFAGIVLEASGRHFFPAYALQIIAEVTGNKTQSFYYTLGIDLIITGSAVFSTFLVKAMKRRKLLFWSGFTSILTLVFVCLYLFLSANDYISTEKHWIPITLFVVYFILSNLGCTAIPLTLLGEVFPLAHRGVGVAVSGVTLSLYLLIVMQATPYSLVSLKVHGTFAVYGATMGLAIVALYYILPETKDRTLQEIEDFFSFGQFRDNRVNDDEKVKVEMISQ